MRNNTRGRNALTDGDPRDGDGTEGINLRGIVRADTPRLSRSQGVARGRTSP
jgi:hypothetical protein